MKENIINDGSGGAGVGVLTASQLAGIKNHPGIIEMYFFFKIIESFGPALCIASASG